LGIQAQKVPFWGKKLFISFIFIFFSLQAYPSDFTPQVEWIKKKGLVTKKFTQEEFKVLKHYLYELLKKNIRKEDIYAILIYFSQVDLEFRESLILLEEIIALLEVKNISSKKLRNFISRKIKIAKINSRLGRDLVLFLIEEIRKLRR